MFNYSELNANVAFLAENIRFLSVKHEQIDMDCLDLAFRICLKCNPESKLTQVKANVFFYLLSNHLGAKLLVPSPPLSFPLIIHLAIRNELDNLLEIFEKLDSKSAQDLTSELIDYLLETSDQQPDFLLFSIDILLSLKFQKPYLINSYKLNSFESKLLAALETNTLSFKQKRINVYLNKILEHIYDTLKLNEMTTKSRAALLDLFKLELNTIEYCIRVIDLIKINSSSNEFSINKLGQCFDLMSLLKQATHSNEINEFYAFLKQVIQLSCGTQFDDYYIMVNKLIGFEQLVERLIFKKDFTELDNKDLNVLFGIEDYMSNETNLYILLQMMNKQADLKSHLLSDYSKLFWSIFTKLALDSKISFISNKIYSNYEITMNDSNEIACLVTSDFNKNLILLVNQLSYENCEDDQNLNKLAELMCVSLDLVANKLVKHALSNKTQIPTLFKLLNRFARLLKCKIRKDSKLNLITQCMKQNLDYIIFNHNEKMLQCYEILIKELSKSSVKLLDFNEYFSVCLEGYLDFEQIFHAANGLIISLEIFEIIFKCLSNNFINLIYFLNMLTFMNFNFQTEPQLVNRILSVKEKCLALIKQLVKYLNYQKPLSKEEVEQLKNYSCQVYWPYSSLVYPLTKHMILPSFFKDLNTFNSATYFNANEQSVTKCLLELVVINSDLSKFDKVIMGKPTCKELQYEIILNLTSNRTSSELKNLFDFVYSLMPDLDVNVDDEIKELIDTENVKVKNYTKLLKFFYETFFYLSTQTNIQHLLSNFCTFLKAYCYNNDLKNMEMNLKLIMLTIFYLLKYFKFLNSDECAEMCRLSVELLNQAVTFHKQNMQVDLKLIVSLCRNNLQFINEKYKNYIYLMSQNFESILGNK